MKLQLRGAAVADDLDVAPEDAVRMARSERFHRGFLGREAGGEVGSGAPPAPAIGDLAICKHALQEAVAEALDGLLDPIDLRRVEPGSDYLH